jgi:peroxiredoxin
MSTVEHSRSPIQPGEPAPDFTLPTVPEEGVVSLADFRGRSPLLLVLLRTVGG